MLIKKVNKLFFSQTFLLFAIIFLASLVFRLTNLNLIEFKTDEAVNLLLSSRPLFGHPFTPGGTVSSVGILNPPFFNYLLFPFTLITLDPRGISFFIGLINSLSIGFLFLIIKRYYGIRIALISTILFAFSPWAILYSRKIWTQDLLAPFFVPLFYSLHKLVLERKTFYWLIYTAVALFLIELHQTSIIFISIITIFLLFQKVKLNLKYTFLGLLIGLSPLIPYFVYEISSSFPDFKTIVLANNRLSAFYNFSIFLRPLQITSQGNFNFVMGNDLLTFSEKFPIIFQLRKVFYLEYLLLPFGLLVFIKKFKKVSFLAYASITLPIIYFLLKIDPLMHYFIILLPLLFIFLATSFIFFIEKKNLIVKSLAILLFLTLVLTSILFNGAFFSLINSLGGLKGDYGATFLSSERIVKNRLKGLQSYPDYNQMFLSSYIPLNYLYGYLPLGRILYGNENEKRAEELEQKLQEGTRDPRVEQELLSYYSRNLPTLESLDKLAKKNKANPQFERIYKLIYQDYLSKNFKKEYVYGQAKIRFFYPEHWSAKQVDGEILLNGDGYKVSVKKLTNGKIKVSCIVVKNKCDKKVIDDIIKSIRPLSSYLLLSGQK